MNKNFFNGMNQHKDTLEKLEIIRINIDNCIKLQTRIDIIDREINNKIDKIKKEGIVGEFKD